MKFPRVRFSWRLLAGALLLATLLIGGKVLLMRCTPSTAQAAEPLNGPVDPAMAEEVTQGALRVKGAGGEVVECPLKHTDVRADISGFIARVTVTQTFYNPYDEKIEAVYVFPLPHTSAVDAMTMVIDDRRIVGQIKRRAEARQIYEAALEQGLTASLLEQERPNIFTQSVGNIKPKQEIKIEISYVDVLAYDMGVYEFHFPMVVGPRYIPGAPISGKAATPPELQGKVGEVEAPANGTAPAGAGWAPDTDRVPDASRITPPVLKPGNRTGHDISLSVTLDAGVPIRDLKIVNHRAEVQREGDRQAGVKLADDDNIPNKDFVMKYAVVGEKPEMALLAHAPDSSGGYFMLMMQPRIDKELAAAPPREIVFLVDVSGSMSGEPTAKVKETMREFFKRGKPNDTIQVVYFYSTAGKLFEKPVPCTPENIDKAMNFTSDYEPGGGTEMLKGIRMVLDEPPDPERVRICVMLTDGFIGNEAEIISAVGKRAGDKIRFWTLGIGSSPNRFLLDGVAKTGGGKSAVIELTTNPAQIVGDIVERIHRAQLAGISIDWGGLDVYDVYPRAIPELWVGSPVILFGRYRTGGAGRIQLCGMAEGKPLTYTLDVELPALESAHDVLAKVWARNKIDDLTLQMYAGDAPEVVDEITDTALEYKLMSQYTSFVAVDEQDAGKQTEPPKPPRRMVVPVPMPEGVSFEGVFGAMDEETGLVDASDGLAVIVGKATKIPGSANQWRAINGSSSTYASAGRGAAAPAPMSTTPLPTLAPPNIPAALPPGVPSPATTAVKPAPSMRLRSSSISGMKAKAANPNRVFYQMSAAPAGKRPIPTPSEARMSTVDRPAVTSNAEWAKNLFASKSDALYNNARAALDKAKEREKAQDYAAAFARYQQAYLLASAAGFWRDNGTAAAAREGLTSAGEALTAANTKALPALGNKLDLMIRDQTVVQALQAIGRASGIAVEFLPGSGNDVRELDDRSELRVSYLDLRGATVAQGLDWLLAPFHLSWQVKGGRIVVGSTRRLEGASPWIYRVGDLTLPVAVDKQYPHVVVEKAMNAFQAGVKTALGQGETAVLLTPDHLLIFADANGHQRVGEFLAALKDPHVNLTGAVDTASFRALRGQTAIRWSARGKERAARRQALEKTRMADTMNTFSWQLLAGAAKGEVDQEALAELQVAWRSLPALKAPDLDVARSAWAISQAARLLPKQAELTNLAAATLGTVRSELALSAGLLKKEANDETVLTVLYGCLILRNAAAVGLARVTPDTVTESLLAKTAAGSPMRVIALSFLAPSGKTDAAFARLIREGGLSGPDLVVLGCLAARQRGGNLRRQFNAELTGLLGAQPLEGNVILTANRLVSRQK